METFIGIILIVMAVFLVVAVLLQSGKSHGLSGSIAGGAETFFGKTKGKRMDKVLSTATTVVAIVFVVIVVLAFFAQDDATYDKVYKDYLDGLKNTESVSGNETEGAISDVETEGASETVTEAVSE